MYNNINYCYQTQGFRNANNHDFEDIVKQETCFHNMACIKIHNLQQYIFINASSEFQHTPSGELLQPFFQFPYFFFIFTFNRFEQYYLTVTAINGKTGIFFYKSDCFINRDFCIF